MAAWAVASTPSASELETESAEQGPSAHGRTEPRSRKERTRDRFVSAATELLRKEGHSALSVSAVSREVGVHHSLFYQHFKDMDACLAEAAKRVLDRLLPIDLELRRRLLREMGVDRRRLAAHYRGSLDRWLEHKPFVELLLTHRLESTPMGETFANALDQLRAEYTEDLWDLARMFKLPRATTALTRTTADVYLSQWLWALEAITTRRIEDRNTVASTLADITFATAHTFISRGQRPDYEELVALSFSAERRAQLLEGGAGLRQLLEAHTDAELVQMIGDGDLQVVVDWVLSAIQAYFMPDAVPEYGSVVRYEIDCGGAHADGSLVIEDGLCTIAPRDDQPRPVITIYTSLRTWLDSIVGDRHLEECVRSGDIRIRGDLRLAADFVEWFYFPNSGL